MIANLISDIIRPQVLALSAYKVAKADNLIKLDAMENPYTWPEKMKQEWLAMIKDSPINRYPDPEATELNQLIRSTHQIPAESAILLGNGSDEIIQLLLMALNPTACVLAPDPSFVMYRQVALSLGLNYQSVALNPDNFNLDLSAMLNAIKTHQPAIIFLAYPNNPTGNLFCSADIEQIITQTKGLVIIDEAYAPFANASFINRLGHYDNLLVMRTVSKLGLAGLRLGFIAGNLAIIEQLNKIRLPYNINILTQVSTVFALHHLSLFDQQTQQICHDREKLIQQLSAFEQLKVYPSAANFILFKSLTNSADMIFDALKQQGILIKNLSPQGGVLSQCLRVTIGKPEENAVFIEALKNRVKTALNTRQ